MKAFAVLILAVILGMYWSDLQGQISDQNKQIALLKIERDIARNDLHACQGNFVAHVLREHPAGNR